MVPASRLSPPSKPVAILTGTTASGKTGIALEFARKHGGLEIINADSLLIYRGFDIGTAKPTRAELTEIPHHLVDIRDATDVFTAGDFVRECEWAIRDVHARGKRALIVGGTGFYLKALLFGLWDAPKAPPALREELDGLTTEELYSWLLERDEASALRITSGDRYRLIRALETIKTTGKTPTELEAEAMSRGSVPGLSLFITDRENDELRARIGQRTDAMLVAGFLDEVKDLLARYPIARALEAVGYREAVMHLKGEKPEGRKIADGIEGLKSEIRLATTQLAKRQRTWFHGQFERATDLQFFTLSRDADQLNQRLQEIYVC